MRGATVAASALILQLAPAVPARGQASPPRVDFSGVWVMDTTKFAKNDPVLIALKLSVRQGADTLRVVTDVTDQRPAGPLTHTTTEATYGFDGRPWSNRMGNGLVGNTVLSWEDTTLVIRSSAMAPDRQPLEITSRWTLDATGTTLTQVQHMQHGQRSLTQTLLFTKQ